MDHAAQYPVIHDRPTARRIYRLCRAQHGFDTKYRPNCSKWRIFYLLLHDQSDLYACPYGAHYGTVFQTDWNTHHVRRSFPQIPTFMQALQGAGYTTYGVGKFHYTQTYPWSTPRGCGMDPVAGEAEQKRFGFDFIWETAGKQQVISNYCFYADYLNQKGLLSQVLIFMNLRAAGTVIRPITITTRQIRGHLLKKTMSML